MFFTIAIPPTTKVVSSGLNAFAIHPEGEGGVLAKDWFFTDAKQLARVELPTWRDPGSTPPAERQKKRRRKREGEGGGSSRWKAMREGRLFLAARLFGRGAPAMTAPSRKAGNSSSEIIGAASDGHGRQKGD